MRTLEGKHDDEEGKRAPDGDENPPRDGAQEAGYRNPFRPLSVSPPAGERRRCIGNITVKNFQMNFQWVALTK